MQSKLVTNRQTRRNLFSLAVFLLVSMYAFAQNAVTGIVKDKTGEPLIGVSGKVFHQCTSRQDFGVFLHWLSFPRN